jgi:hypothetical protein
LLLRVLELWKETTKETAARSARCYARWVTRRRP